MEKLTNTKFSLQLLSNTEQSAFVPFELTDHQAILNVTIELKPLKVFSLEQQLSFGFSGYQTAEIYEVNRNVTEGSLSLNMNKTELSEPYIKQWTYTQKDIEHYKELIEEQLSVGAYDGEKLVGVAICSKREWNNSLWLDYIEIADRYRKLGIGSLLIKELDAIALNNQLRMIELETQNTNVPALNFYFKNGFEFCGIHFSLYDPREVSPLEKAVFLAKMI